MMCLHTKYHMRSFNGSLVIAMKPNIEYRPHTAAMLFFIFYTKTAITKAICFSKFYCHIPFPYSKLSGAGVVSTSRIRASAMLLLPIV